MALLGMQAEIDQKSYYPGHYSTRDLNLGSNGSIWPLNNVDTILMNGHYYNDTSSPPSPNQHLVHNREVLKQTVLKHEATFRDQEVRPAGDSGSGVADAIHLQLSRCGSLEDHRLDFLTVPRPARFSLSNIDIPDTSKKMGLICGASAASGISGSKVVITRRCCLGLLEGPIVAQKLMVLPRQNQLKVELKVWTCI